MIEATSECTGFSDTTTFGAANTAAGSAASNEAANRRFNIPDVIEVILSFDAVDELDV
jgi:hypothetical protein